MDVRLLETDAILILALFVTLLILTMDEIKTELQVLDSPSHGMSD